MEFARFSYNCFSPLLKHGFSKTGLPGVQYTINKNNNNNSDPANSPNNNSNNNSGSSSGNNSGVSGGGAEAISHHHKKKIGATTTSTQHSSSYHHSHHHHHHHRHHHHHHHHTHDTSSSTRSNHHRGTGTTTTPPIGTPKKHTRSTLYDVLGVKKTSSANEIRVAYKKLCLQFHPDHNPNGREQFENIHEAYQVLRDPSTRQKYDFEQRKNNYSFPTYFPSAAPSSTTTTAAKTTTTTSTTKSSTTHPATANSCSNSTKTPSTAKINIVEDNGQDVRLNISCSLEDLYRGRMLKLKVMRNLVCDSCCAKLSSVTNSSSSSSSSSSSLSSATATTIDSADHHDEGTDSCVCEVCGGKIIYSRQKTFTVNIRPGMRSGQSIAFMGKGNESFCQYTSDRVNKTRGNVVITIDQTPHDQFTRNGDHLFINHALTPKEALTGVYSFCLSHLDGRTLHVTSDHHHTVRSDRDGGVAVKNGDVQCLFNEGMPKLQTPDMRGNLYIKFQVAEQPVLDQVSEKELKRMIRNMKRTMPSNRFVSPSSSSSSPLSSPSMSPIKNNSNSSGMLLSSSPSSIASRAETMLLSQTSII